jgi:biotin operon repressor
MRRADRLFQIVQFVRGRRLSTAEFVAQRLEVSVRTVYRDIVDLQRQGVPIEGEAGVGYRMRAGFDLPPLMFTRDEAQSPVAAVRLAQPRLDGKLAARAESALSKILSVLPAAARTAAESLAVYAPPVGPDAATRRRLEKCAWPRRRTTWCAWSTSTTRASAASAGCARWAASSGARCGRSPPGANCGRPCAAFASTTSKRWRCWTSAFATSQAGRCQTSFA